MKRFAVAPVSGGVVSNIVVGDDIASVSNAIGECIEETDSTGTAIIGYAWNGAAFVQPPFSSWLWVAGDWEAPIPMPETGGPWMWDEDTGKWQEMPMPTP